MEIWMLLPLVNALECINYGCSDSSSLDLSGGICGQLDPSSGQYILNSEACKSPNYCPYPAHDIDDILYCQKPVPVLLPQGFPGEPCDSQHICLNEVSCMNGLCATTTFNCTNVGDCGPGKYCANHTCWTQVPVGGMCLNSTDCVNSALCDRDKGDEYGMCVQYASVPGGHRVLGCPFIGEDLVPYNLCQSGLCFLNETLSEYQCSYILENAQPIPWVCKGSDDNCVSTQDPASQKYYTQDCACGYNGSSFCPQFAGDPDMSLYLTDIVEFITNSTIERCNTARHAHSFPYLTDPRWSWCSGTNLTDTQLYRALRATLYPQVISASACVLKALQPQYYSLSAEVRKGWAVAGVLGIIVLG